ncbi:DUF4296 domain-containing protein [Pedobacter sp.]|uniref:DUF4296 domain-containing protein n=1 Tax=Pedobacter sp. TaxID=1411316 RepID=UPI003D7FE614
MKNIFLYCFLFLVIAGCKDPIPKDVIQPDKMGKILYDIHIVDAYINTMPNPDSSKKVAAAYYKGIYKKFGIDSVAYHKSMDFYYNNPEVMAKMYESIQGSLSKTKTKIEKAQQVKLELANKKQAKKDSLKADSVKKVALKKTKDSLVLVKTKKGKAKIKADSLLKVKEAKLKKSKKSIAPQAMPRKVRKLEEITKNTRLK